jgi:hypothetical protein
LELRAAGQLQRNVVEVDSIAQAVAFQPVPQFGVPISLAKIRRAAGGLGRSSGRAANFCGRTVSSNYGNQAPAVPEQTEPAEIRRKNR